MARVPENLRAMMLTPLLCPNDTATDLENLHRFLGCLGYRRKILYEKRAAEKPAKSVLFRRRFYVRNNFSAAKYSAL